MVAVDFPYFVDVLDGRNRVVGALLHSCAAVADAGTPSLPEVLDCAVRYHRKRIEYCTDEIDLDCREGFDSGTDLRAEEPLLLVL